MRKVGPNMRQKPQLWRENASSGTSPLQWTFRLLPERNPSDCAFFLALSASIRTCGRVVQKKQILIYAFSLWFRDYLTLFCSLALALDSRLFFFIFHKITLLKNLCSVYVLPNFLTYCVHTSLWFASFVCGTLQTFLLWSAVAVCSLNEVHRMKI